MSPMQPPARSGQNRSPRMSATGPILVTGGAGFIGANFVLDWIRETGNPVVNVDNLTYAGNLQNLAALDGDPRHVFVRGDICERATIDRLLAEHRPGAVVHFAAETHVDRSIHGPREFVRTNIEGTFTLLEAARGYWGDLDRTARDNFRFLHVSTDEVYGSLGPSDPPFAETNAYTPNSPYSASKAASDHLVRAYHHTYGLPVLTTNCSNNYGPYQFPEKLIPLTIANGLEDKPIPVYGDGLQERDWLYVEDYCRAIERALERGKPGEIYNVSSGVPQANLRVIQKILELLGKPDSLIQFVEDRPGHDRRYALDSAKIRRGLGWKNEVSFEEGIRRTIEWYQHNTLWLERTQSEEYLQYYDRHYTRRPETLKNILK